MFVLNNIFLQIITNIELYHMTINKIIQPTTGFVLIATNKFKLINKYAGKGK